MKNLKLLALFVLITAALLFMFSCNKVEITNNPDDIYDEKKTDSSGLLVKEKTYPYGENDVLLLSVNNPTDKNLSITINVSYFDADKKLLKEDVRTYDQMYSGGGNNFIFNPEIGFDSYSYSISTEEYNGTIIAKDVGLNFNDLGRQIKGKEDGRHAIVSIKAELLYNGNLPAVWIGADFIIIDKNGELNGVYSIGNKSLVYSGASNYKPVSILESETEDISIPDVLNGNISIIYDFTKIEPYNDTHNNGTDIPSGDTMIKNNTTPGELPDDFVIKEKEYKVGDKTYYLICIKNTTNIDYMLKYRVTTYENGKSLGSDTTIFGNYSSGYENYFWFPKYLTYDNDTYEYKYEFFVSSSDGKNINLRLSFDNVSKQPYDNKEIIVGDLSPHSDITLNNVFVSGHLIVFDKTGNVCYTSKIGTVFNDNTPVEISFPLLTSTAVEDMDFIIALNAVY